MCLQTLQHSFSLIHSKLRHIFNIGTEHEIFLNLEDGSSEVSTPMIATVIKSFEPFSISPVMHVRLSTSNPNALLPSEAILKLYDRRYTFDERDYYKSGPWPPSRERAHQESKARGGWKDGKAPNPIDRDTDWKDWGAGEMESFLEAIVHQSYTNELSVYRHLRVLQGTQIPKLYGEVSLRYDDLELEVRGILIEYIPSFSLKQVPELVPKGGWDVIGNEAIALVNRLSDQGIINSDARLDNILVKTTDPKHLVMIDFGMARVRLEDENDEKWRKLKRWQDEEGAVGYVYAKHLKGKYKYKPSLRYWREGDVDSD